MLQISLVLTQCVPLKGCKSRQKQGSRLICNSMYLLCIYRKVWLYWWSGSWKDVTSSFAVSETVHTFSEQ